MKTRHLPIWLLALAANGLLALSAHSAARLLPFQGRLSDANGAAIADGARVIQFKIYDAPVGGRTVWNGEVQKLTVNGGLVSTILGTKAALSGMDFNQDLYLEITIDANGDNQITLSDPPLLPRQSILPAVFAYESANSQALGGYDWSPLFGTNNPADGTLLDSKIADASLTTAKIADGAITTPKIADGSITTAKIPNGAITRSKLDVTGASAGQSLTYNGSQVVWGHVNAVNADTLDGFDWSHFFDNANPSNGRLNVASMNSRGSLDVAGSATFSATAFFNGPSITVQGLLVAPSIGINMFLNDWGLHLRNPGDFNHGLRYGNSYGGTSGFDGAILYGLGGGVLGGGGAWTLRWNGNGTVNVRGTLSTGSDRDQKENFKTVDSQHVLSKVLALPITRWNYKDDPKANHIGPVAQDFRAAFGLGSDDKSIATVDADGVALAAIQGLNNKLEDQVAELRALLKTQQQQIQALKAEVAAFKTARK